MYWGPDPAPGRTGTPERGPEHPHAKGWHQPLRAGCEAVCWGHEMDQSLCRVFCSTLLCSGGRVLVLPAWTIFIKVAAFLFKAFCFFVVG